MFYTQTLRFVRRISVALVALITVFGGAATAQPNSGALDTAFNPFITSSNGVVRAVAVQPDGKIIIAGSFVQTGSVVRRNVARLNADGSPDTSFNPGSGANSSIGIVALFPDNKILIVGDFTSYNGVRRDGVARLNADGSLDNSFNYTADNSGGGNSGVSRFAFIVTAAIQPDGKVLLGKSSSLSCINCQVPSEAALVRLNADGSRDTSFNQNSATAYKAAATAIAVQADGKIVVGGFASASFNGETPKNLARLNTDGTLDTSFDVGAGFGSGTSGRPGTATKIVVQPDNKILVGGNFSSYNNQPVNSFVRLNPNGSLETAFAPAFPDATEVTVSSFLLQPDNKIVVASVFVRNSIQESNLRRINADGSADNSFSPPASTAFVAINLVRQPDGKILLIGGVPTFLPVPGAGVQTLSRLNESGSADNSFAPVIRGVGTINTVLPRGDGKIVIGGNFVRVDNTARTNIARLNANGTLDTAFNATVNQLLTNKIVAQPDGKLLVGGFAITIFGGNSAIVRLNENGATDNSFASPFRSGAQVTDILVQPDNKILVVGAFPATDNQIGGAQTVVRLNQNGAIDASFDASAVNAEMSVNAIALQSDGKILIGGNPANNSGIGLRRVLPNGALDQTFAAPASFIGVNDIELLPNNRILVGGSIRTGGAFSSGAGVARLNADGTFDNTFGANGRSTVASSVLDLKVQPDGKILYSGFGQITFNGGSFGFAILTNTIGRLTVNGFADNSFARRTIAAQTIELQPDNRILLGGTFDSFDDAPVYSLVRLSNTLRAPATAFDFSGDGRADLSVFRPSEGNWYLQLSGSNTFGGATQWGVASDKLAPADYDGDGKTDFAVWRDDPANPGQATFYILNSRDNSVRVEQFGASGDVPAPGDWDNDGRADLAVYRSGTAGAPQSRFFYRPSSQTGSSFAAIDWGANGDIPVANDYDADGRTDAAVFRPSNGTWYILQSLDNQPRFVNWGLRNDRLVPADYDGDSKTDIAVYRGGIWYILQSSLDNQPRYEQFGVADDIPVPADYDGDARADIAVWRASNGVWWLQQSNAGILGVTFGVSTDKPVPAALLPAPAPPQPDAKPQPKARVRTARRR